MSLFLSIHPENPQPRQIKQAVEHLRKGGVIAYPTDSSYALGCQLEDKKAVERLRAIRQIDDRHFLTLVCRDLSEVARYARVDNVQYRMMKHGTPGPYTFILEATKEAPRRLWTRRNTIGLRVPANPIAHALLAELGEPLLSATLHLPGDDYPLSDPWEIDARLCHALDVIIDGGHCGLEPSTVVDLSGKSPEIVRRGLGDVALLGLE
ncbi:MAG: threonylcarbamoyl-AMP synthase [Betaproteobacteria bacterium]|nr:threonylcarbamoyl-AMP synthase [Betaproteobacteria bacterium]